MYTCRLTHIVCSFNKIDNNMIPYGIFSMLNLIYPRPSLSSCINFFPLLLHEAPLFLLSSPLSKYLGDSTLHCSHFPSPHFTSLVHVGTLDYRLTSEVLELGFTHEKEHVMFDYLNLSYLTVYKLF